MGTTLLQEHHKAPEIQEKKIIMLQVIKITDPPGR